MVLVLSENRRSALAQALSEPLSVLGDRSPGACETAQLRPTKATPRAALPRGKHLPSD